MQIAKWREGTCAHDKHSVSIPDMTSRHAARTAIPLRCRVTNIFTDLQHQMAGALCVKPTSMLPTAMRQCRSSAPRALPGHEG